MNYVTTPRVFATGFFVVGSLADLCQLSRSHWTAAARAEEIELLDGYVYQEGEFGSDRQAAVDVQTVERLSANVYPSYRHKLVLRHLAGGDSAADQPRRVYGFVPTRQAWAATSQKRAYGFYWEDAETGDQFWALPRRDEKFHFFCLLPPEVYRNDNKELILRRRETCPYMEMLKHLPWRPAWPNSGLSRAAKGFGDNFGHFRQLLPQHSLDGFELCYTLESDGKKVPRWSLVANATYSGLCPRLTQGEISGGRHSTQAKRLEEVPKRPTGLPDLPADTRLIAAVWESWIYDKGDGEFALKETSLLLAVKLPEGRQLDEYNRVLASPLVSPLPS